MSHALYNALWVDTQKYIERTLPQDRRASVAKPEPDKELAHAAVSKLHLKYIDIIKHLEQCYDQIAQPQKRIVIRTLLDMCLGRCLELKHELVELDLSDFNYSDNIVIEMKLVPMEVEVTIPNYFIREREEELERRKKAMTDIVAKLGLGQEKVSAAGPTKMTPLEVRLMLQRHERARQGRMKAVTKQRLKGIKAKAAKGIKPTKEEKQKKEEAAIMIQKIWRGYRVRQWVKYRKTQEGLLIGLYQPSWRSTVASRKYEDVRAYRHGLQTANQLEYEQALIDEKAKIVKRKGPWIIEDFCDEIREWFIEWYKKTGRFPYPEYPDEDEGGSALLVAGKVMTPEQYLELQIAIAKEKAKPKAQKLKEKAELAKKKAKEKALALKALELAKKKAEEEKNKPFEGFQFKPSKFVKPLDAATKVYNTVWKNKPDKNNPKQKHHVDMIIAEKQKEVEVELRLIVDVLMRAEMELLEIALEKDILKRKKGKKGKKKKKKKKKKKPKRSKKKKKDPTSHRTTEEIFEELFSNGIIRKYPEEKLSNFIGEFSYNNFERRKIFQNPLPCLGDIRQVILEYCILPMGSPSVHLSAPLVKSMCLCGPRGSGKHLLANAICTELGAVMFDLTPSNVVGKYPGKAGLKMLFHLVDKMSRILQPSIIYTDGAEKHFYKKVPKPERKNEPKRVGKVMPKLTKGITALDQVMVLGISKEPWAAKPRKFVKTYQKIIMIPWADYGTLYHVWRDQLMQYHGVHRDLDISAIARLSTGYPIGQIRDIVAMVMTPRRILRLKHEPLTPREVLETLLTVEPVTQKDMDKYTKWFNTKTKMGKKKAKLMKAEALLREEAQKLKEAEEKNARRNR